MGIREELENRVRLEPSNTEPTLELMTRRVEKGSPRSWEPTCSFTGKGAQSPGVGSDLPKV